MTDTTDTTPAKSTPARRVIPVLFQGHARLTWALLAVILLIFTLEETLGGSEIGPVLVRLGANLPSDNSMAAPWRLISSIFLHIGWMHLAANCVVLLFLGRFFEKLVGSQRFFLLFLFSGIAGSFASSLFSGADLSAGASGGLWGLLGACLGLSLFPGPVFPSPWVKSFRKNTIFNLGLNLYFSTLANIDFAAHLGGGIMGLILFGSGFLTRGLPLQPHYPVPRLIKFGLSRVFLLAVLTTGLALMIPWLQNRPQELWQPDMSKTQNLSLGDKNDPNPFNLVFQSPSFLSLASINSEQKPMRRFVLGNLKKDPVMLLVSWRPLTKTLNNKSEQKQAALEVLEHQKTVSLPKEVSIQKEFTWLEKVYDPSWYRTIKWNNGVVQSNYAQMQSNALLEIQVLYYDIFTEQYEQMGHSILESIKLQPVSEKE